MDNMKTAKNVNNSSKEDPCDEGEGKIKMPNPHHNAHEDQNNAQS